MSFQSTACFAPTLSWKSRDRDYGSKCGATYGPNAQTQPFERRVGLQAAPATRRRTRSSTPVGARGWPNKDKTPYEKWCSYWQSNPGQDEGAKAPDLSATQELPRVMRVDEQERALRRDVNEDSRWALQHNNAKPEKLLRWHNQRNESKMIEDATSPCKRSQSQDVWNAESASDETLMRNKNWCNLMRPRRLEPCDSPLRMWTPRTRPKTPTPVDLRQRGSQNRQPLKLPEPQERDPNNPRDVKNMQLQAFGFTSTEHTFPVQDKSKSREYERHSDYLVDRATHQRIEHDPKTKFLKPITTQMEVGWDATDSQFYKPIGGPSPSKVDLTNGLPRMSMAGGTSGRLCSPVSKFIDNVLMTRPDFNAF